ncbi:MAG TPA: transposase [Thermoanaerobaculia bacterium]|jgi:REP element-mobilizing transposase RayT|nr:transposase [Thermoanaerobaculia bacterium]
MSRPLRFIPEEGALVDITCRTIQSRYLLRPDPALNEILLGVLGQAQRLHPVEIVASFVASNHYHLLIWVPDAKRMADFMGYFQTNAAREVGRLREWRAKVWSRRYEAIVVSDEPAAQVDRLRYMLANGVKEGLVARVEDWPGISLVKSVLSGEPVRGTWFNRTTEHRAKLRGEDFDPRRYATEETVVLSQLPCWRHLSPEKYREQVAGLVQEIDVDAATERKRSGRGPLGVKAILSAHPHTWPNKSKKSPAPRFHAASKAAREALRAAYGLFLAAFREAAERLKAGDRSANFPSGCFPPGLPFVAA